VSKISLTLRHHQITTYIFTSSSEIYQISKDDENQIPSAGDLVGDTYIRLFFCGLPTQGMTYPQRYLRHSILAYLQIRCVAMTQFVYRRTRDSMMSKRPILRVPSKTNNDFNTKCNCNTFTCIRDKPSMLKDEKSGREGGRSHKAPPFPHRGKHSYERTTKLSL
jgi:hypothetical protein